MEEKIILEKQKQADISYYMPDCKMLENLSLFFSAFSDSTRLKILTALAVSEICVSDLSIILKTNQTTISHQLKLLKTLNLVSCRREGKLLFYSLATNCVNEVMLNGVNYLIG